jgi:hypothetical protein
MLGVDVNSLFLPSKPGQRTGQAEQGLAQKDVDQKEKAQRPASIRDRAKAHNRNQILGEESGL